MRWEDRGHTQLLHTVVDQLLLLLFVGDGLRLQLAGLWTRPRSEAPHPHPDRWGRQGWGKERGLTWLCEAALQHLRTCHPLLPQRRKVHRNPPLNESQTSNAEKCVPREGATRTSHANAMHPALLKLCKTTLGSSLSV